ncbi:SH3-like domain-containing protein, partial [Vagococcus sp. DIV0080]
MKKYFVSLLCITSIITVPALTITEATGNSSTENETEKATETTSSLDFSVIESSEMQIPTDDSKKDLNTTEFDKIESSTSSSEIEEGNIEYHGDKITEENQSVLGENVRIETKSTVRSFSAERSLSSNNLNMPRIDFVDVSSHQGEITVQDYLKMKGQGVTGVVVKLTEGTSYINPFAYSQIRNAQTAGLKVSAYHYSWFVNKKTAEAEARYFAQVAQQNGLDINTVMVNDAEEQSTNNGNLTQNSLYFMETLNKEFGFKQVVHYSMASWFTTKILDMSKLGGDKASWKAQFPFVPSKDNLLHTESSAWQWSSDMHFVGDSKKDRTFDTNIDYTGTFSSLRNFEYIPFSKKTFINKTNADIYNQPYQSGTWRQDKTLGMSNELITISAQSRTSYGLWYEFMYQKDGMNKVGWIKSNDVSDIIDEREHQQTLFVKKATGSIYDSPYVPGTEEIDKTFSLENNQFNKTKEARTGYGLWYYGSYTKNGKVKTGWIKSVDLEAETVNIEAYTNKGIINKNYGAVYESPYIPGVSEKDTLVGLQEEVVTIKSKSQTNSGLWYESTYKKNGVTKSGWI